MKLLLINKNFQMKRLRILNLNMATPNLNVTDTGEGLPEKITFNGVGSDMQLSNPFVCS